MTSSNPSTLDVLAVPPPSLQSDPDGAQAARQRLARKGPFAHLIARAKHPSTPSLPLPSQPEPVFPDVPQVHVADHDEPITLDSSALDDDDITRDRYEWAILYENQRGLTVFSSPYYSSLSLLPSDPSPFTVPHASLKRSEQPPITLDTYPLPDGNWRWVSRCWMIDMRSDTGQVQHDGFEYNWVFRKHHWRARVGSFNAGGWVRRRRWVRLMVRPAQPTNLPSETSTPKSTSATNITLEGHRSRHQSIVSSLLPPSVSSRTTYDSEHLCHVNPDDVWLGQVESDWQRCRAVMKRLDRDGKKLELWQCWLGFYHPEHKHLFVPREDVKGKKRAKQWTEDDDLPLQDFSDHPTNEVVTIAPQEHVISVLRKYGKDLLSLFVFPESRAQLLKLLGQAKMLDGLDMASSFGYTEVEFWSYASLLGDTMGQFKAGSGCLSVTEVKTSSSASLATV